MDTEESYHTGSIRMCIQDGTSREATLESRREADGFTIPSATSLPRPIKSAHSLQGNSAKSRDSKFDWREAPENKKNDLCLEHTDSGIQISWRLCYSRGCDLFLNPIFHQRLPSSRSSIHHLTVPRPNIRTKMIVFNLWLSARQLLPCQIRSKKSSNFAPSFTHSTRECPNTAQSDALKAKTTDRGASGLRLTQLEKHTDHI